ncbi:MAG: DMT family transporter [Variovorax sp.]
MILAGAAFTALDATTKVAGVVVPVFMGVWFRYSFQAIATTAMILPRYGIALLRTAHPRFHFLRGALLLLNTVLTYISLRFMPLPEYTSTVLLAPLAVTLLAAVTLKEQVSALRWTLVAGAFLGTLVILRPDGRAFSWPTLLPLAVVASNAAFQILTSKLVKTENPLTMHFYTGWVGALLSSFVVPFVWQALPSWHYWAMLCFMGFMGSVGHFLLILAFQRAPASTLTPYIYVQIGFSLLASWLVFARVPDVWSLVGMGLIGICGAAGAWLTIRERRLPLEAPAS